VTLAINVAGREAVDTQYAAAVAAGARVVGAPVDREWGGYSGYVALAMVAEFEADLARARTREGMAVAKAKSRP